MNLVVGSARANGIQPAIKLISICVEHVWPTVKWKYKRRQSQANVQATPFHSFHPIIDAKALDLGLLGTVHSGAAQGWIGA